jgi:hypothetical protein
MCQMQICRNCSRSNPAEAIYCRECGRPLASVATGDDNARTAQVSVASDASAPTLPRVAAAREERAGGPPSRVAVLVIGVLGLAGLAAGTGLKLATHRGRSVPSVDPKLRALPPPTSEDGDAATDTPSPAKPEPSPREPASSPPTPTPPALTPPTPTPPSPTPPSPTPPSPTPPAPTPPGVTPPSARQIEPKTPERKVAPRPLGPPPTDSEIRACINRRRARVRACADEASQRMEYVGGGRARATLNPSGGFSNIRVPGEGYFASCATRVIRALRCRPFRGGPIEVSYPLR